MKPEFDLLNKMQAGATICLSDGCSGCPYENTDCNNTLMRDILQLIANYLELQKIIDEAKIIPALEEAQAYLRNQGFPEAAFADSFCTMTGKRRAQFWECVRNNYDLADFERWQVFQDAVNGEIPWDDFCKIGRILWEHDIEIMEMETGKDSIYEN